MKKKKVSILGAKIELVSIPRDELKGLNTDMLLRFFYYEATFHNQAICIVQAKNNEVYTPLKYRKITEQIEQVVCKPDARIEKELELLIEGMK